MHNITSPRPDTDETVEDLIRARGLTAPRITPVDIDRNIVSCYFFTAEEGVLGEEAANARPSAPYESGLSLLTFCVLVLRNGFIVTGESACASPENFDADVVKRIARTNAVNKIWPLMGYELKSKLAE